MEEEPSLGNKADNKRWREWRVVSDWGCVIWELGGSVMLLDILPDRIRLKNKKLFSVWDWFLTVFSSTLKRQECCMGLTPENYVLNNVDASQKAYFLYRQLSNCNTVRKKINIFYKYFYQPQTSIICIFLFEWVAVTELFV